MKKEYEDQEKTIREIDKRKKEIIKELENLSKKLIIQIEEMSEICSTIRERCNNEIERQSLVLAESSFSKYYSQKKIDGFKAMLEKLDKEQKEMETFLVRLKGKSVLNMIKDVDIMGLLSSSKSGIQSALNNSYKTVKKRGMLGTLKSGYETARNISFLATEYDYIGYYSELCAKYWQVGKEVKDYKVKHDKGGKLIFYEKVFKMQETDPPSYKVELEVVDCNAKLENLRSKNNKLNKKFKTQQELERESKDTLLATKDLKKKSIETRKKIEQLKNENEISEKRVEEAEAKLEEERRAREEERRAKEEERRAKEEERKAREKAEAKTKAIDLLYDEADDQGISTKRIKQNEDVQKFLKCQYTFLVLNEDCITKFKGLCREYRNLRREIKEPNFERLSELANEFDRLSRSFAEGEREEEESRENVPGCNDQSIDRLKCDIVTRVVQARDVAEREKKTVEKEKTEVEEIVKRLQMQAPNSTFSGVSHELVAG
ncbi:hypothetical protein, partial [Wolbachia endosymbiont of Drosophila auraria]|uniref:hypothetical protein n=1 Tax=Wolbachia endosymbiont of Drosophila auraria TaxID=553632 RepID=UPI001B3025F8